MNTSIFDKGCFYPFYKICFAPGWCLHGKGRVLLTPWKFPVPSCGQETGTVPLWPFCFLTAAKQSLGLVSWEGRGVLSRRGKQSPLRFQQRGERSYELMVCAQHSWQGSLHEFLKQFSAETAPSTTWNSIFQGKSSLVWAADQLPCHLLTQLLWPGELWAAPATPGLHQGRVWPMSSTFLPLPT